ncbi:hypothetical protein [Nocardia amikacinitolerans]|uniref:hypothetical protein n=1 Tax=Nocardia amikacinitolerans TaxID=756689 RepID=UPI0020A5AA9E|nr:hypothetical protein [Nocardia amikacinitolerans]
MPNAEAGPSPGTATSGDRRQPQDRLREATERGWLGEVDGLQISLDAANQKLIQMRKIRSQARIVDLPAPALR